MNLCPTLRMENVTIGELVCWMHALNCTLHNHIKHLHQALNHWQIYWWENGNLCDCHTNHLKKLGNEIKRTFITINQTAYILTYGVFIYLPIVHLFTYPWVNYLSNSYLHINSPMGYGSIYLPRIRDVKSFHEGLYRLMT